MSHSWIFLNIRPCSPNPDATHARREPKDDKTVSMYAKVAENATYERVFRGELIILHPILQVSSSYALERIGP